MNEVKEYFKKWGSVCRMYEQDKPIHCHDTLLIFAKNYHEEQVKKLIIPDVMHLLPDLISKSLPLFIEEYKNLASKEFLTKVWEYGNNQWENGYSQGKYNPDFD